MTGGKASHDASGAWVPTAAFIACATAAVLAAGCTREEKILEVDTPGGSVEITKEKPVTE